MSCLLLKHASKQGTVVLGLSFLVTSLNLLVTLLFVGLKANICRCTQAWDQHAFAAVF